MKELKCPKCGNVFKVDEADYAAIVGQVKNAEFNQEVERRMKELEKQQKAEQKAETLKAEQNYQKLLSEKELNLTQKDAEIAKLQSQLEGIENTNQLSLAKEIAKKDKEIAALQTQLSSNESKLKVAILEEKNKSKETLQENSEAQGRHGAGPEGSNHQGKNLERRLSKPTEAQAGGSRSLQGAESPHVHQDDWREPGGSLQHRVQQSKKHDVPMRLL